MPPSILGSKSLVEPCRCPSCSSDPWPTYSADFLRRCEARAVLRLPTLNARRDYLAKIGKSRGEAGRIELEALMRDEWDKRRSA